MRGGAKTISGVSFAWDGDWYHVSGTATGDIGWSAYKSSQMPVVAGKQYTLSIEFADGMPDADSYKNSSFQLLSEENALKSFAMYRSEHVALSFDQATLDGYGARFQIWGPVIKGGATVDLRVRWMLVEGDTPAAWAPAEGETLAGGALMSANLWDTSTENFKPDANGVYLVGKSTGELKCTITGASALAENQTVHMGASLRGSGKGALKPFVEYKDAAGNVNWVGFPAWTPTDQWQRFEGSCVVPSGMTPTYFGFNTSKATGDMEMLNPAFSYGSPVTLASSAHTPYATQDHLRSEYATKAALKVTSDAVTAEVTERGKLAGRVGTLESTSGTHTSKLEQLATSITSLVKGESTYTDPDGVSATSGIYSLVTQTRDSVTALFGDYTKTADLASTEAVRDAKKAGTDAQAAASAAQSMADSAKSTAQAAASDAATAKNNAASAVSTANSASSNASKAVSTANAASSTANTASSNASAAVSTASSAKDTADSAVSTANAASSTASAAQATADSLATMIREDATGITVGKSADGKTYATGRTHMDEDSFDILDNAGNILSSFGEKIIELGKNSQDAVISMLGGLATIAAQKFGVVSGIEISANGIGLQATSGGMNIHSHFPSTGRGGVGQVDVSTNLVREDPMLSVWVADTTDGDEDGVSIGVTPFGVTTNHPEYMRSAIGLGFKRLYYDYDAGWVVYASDCLVWVYAWGVATGSGSWDSTTCPYVLPEKYRPSLSHITAPVITDNGGSWTGSLVVKSDGTITVSNRGSSGSTDARYGVLFYPVGV